MSKKIRLIIADSSPIVRIGLHSLFSKTSFEIIAEASTAAELLQKLTSEPVDLILAETSFPDGSGFDILQSIRQNGSQTPFVFLAQSDSMTSLARALAAGADGYFFKTVLPEHLLQTLTLLIEHIQTKPTKKAEENESPVETKEPSPEYPFAAISSEDDSFATTQNSTNLSLNVPTTSGLTSNQSASQEVLVQAKKRKNEISSAVAEENLFGELRRVSPMMLRMNRPNNELNYSLTPREQQILIQLTLGLSNKEIANTLGIAQVTVKEHVQNILRKLNVNDRTQAAVFAVQHKIV